MDSVKASDADIDGLPLKDGDKAKLHGRIFFFVRAKLSNVDGTDLSEVYAPNLSARTKSGGSALHPALAERHAVYAIDTLGEAGGSVQTAPFEDIRDRAAALDDVFETLGLTAVHLVGGSTGGWHAVNQAIHAPGRLASIGLLDARIVSALFARKVFCTARPLPCSTANACGRFLTWSAGRTSSTSPPPRLVLALFGGRSVVHDPVAAAARFESLLPHVDVEILPDAGHYLYLRPEDRDLIVDRLLEWLAWAARAPEPRRAATRLARHAAISRAEAALSPWPHSGQDIVTAPNSSSTETVNAVVHERHQRCRVIGLTCSGEATHWWIQRPCTWQVRRSTSSASSSIAGRTGRVRLTGFSRVVEASVVVFIAFSFRLLSGRRWANAGYDSRAAFFEDLSRSPPTG
ncbi:alpha/beta fold hydrolase [Amycolatopsis sp. cmx-11-51]|uniref:alpha/beta fold hydrolase n=1 Tax=Amycolatopsis sp. cmx-11-51 TaxID=2785797 RepID=UPI0039E55537